MTILIDSSVLIAAHNESDSTHKMAQNIMGKIRAGEYGEPAVSDYVFDEAVTVIEARMKSKQQAVDLGEQLKGADIAFFRVNEEVFEAAWDRFKECPGLSFTDCTSLALCEINGIGAIATFRQGVQEAKRNTDCRRISSNRLENIKEMTDLIIQRKRHA